MLEQERAFYDANLTHWLTIYAGRFIAIKGDTLIGTYDTPDTALKEMVCRFGIDNYLIRRVELPPPPVWIPALSLGVLTLPHSAAGSSSTRKEAHMATVEREYVMLPSKGAINMAQVAFIPRKPPVPQTTPSHLPRT